MLSCLYRNCEPVTKLMRILSVFNTYSALSELYGMGVAAYLRLHRRLFTLSHLRGFRWLLEAPLELCLHLNRSVWCISLCLDAVSTYLRLSVPPSLSPLVPSSLSLLYALMLFLHLFVPSSLRLSVSPSLRLSVSHSPLLFFYFSY